jgi:histidinol-phosphate aminotransferase
VTGALPPIRADLVGVEPYGAPQLDVPVRLNTNETPVPPPPGFLAEVARRLQLLELNRYPDREARALREALAMREGFDAEQVWVANGSNEVLLQLLQLYGGPDRSALIFRPGYSMYPELCRTTGTRALVAALPADGRLRLDGVAAAIGDHDPDLVLLANPNNPTGALVGPEVVRALHDAQRGLLVVDEAYIEFAPDGSSVRPLLAELPRLVISRTFSKAFRLAGLRLGYLLAPAQVVEDLHKVRLPYHLDALTQTAGLVALEQEPAFLDQRRITAEERERIALHLRALPGVAVVPSSANFLLFTSPVPETFQRLLDRGVLVRDVSSSVGTAGALRVTVGTVEENDRFLTAMDAVLGEK